MTFAPQTKPGPPCVHDPASTIKGLCPDCVLLKRIHPFDFHAKLENPSVTDIVRIGREKVRVAVQGFETYEYWAEVYKCQDEFFTVTTTVEPITPSGLEMVERYLIHSKPPKTATPVVTYSNLEIDQGIINAHLNAKVDTLDQMHRPRPQIAVQCPACTAPLIVEGKRPTVINAVIGEYQGHIKFSDLAAAADTMNPNWRQQATIMAMIGLLGFALGVAITAAFLSPLHP